MGLKLSTRVRNRQNRGGDDIDKAAFEQIIKDNWDTLRNDIFAASPEEQAEALKKVSDQIPEAKEILVAMYDKDGAVEDF